MLEILVGIIAILLLLIIVIFLYCAGIINERIDKEYVYGERKSIRSKKTNNRRNRK